MVYADFLFMQSCCLVFMQISCLMSDGATWRMSGSGTCGHGNCQTRWVMLFVVYFLNQQANILLSVCVCVSVFVCLHVHAHESVCVCVCVCMHM